MRSVSFALVAHVDHGKSTLSTALIEAFKGYRFESRTFLDNLKVERERGITVRAQAVSLLEGELNLNLVDTPGHLDFQGEVIKSLGAVDLAVLLVSAADGVQAQTRAYHALARSSSLPLAVVVTKLDRADAGRLREAFVSLRALALGETIAFFALCSAHSGAGIRRLRERLLAAARAVPLAEQARAGLQVLASSRERGLGYRLLVKSRGLELSPGTSLFFRGEGEVRELRVRAIVKQDPFELPCSRLTSGDVAYLLSNLTAPLAVGTGLYPSASECRSGDSEPGSGSFLFQKLVVPLEGGSLEELGEALRDLSANDPSLACAPSSHPMLGKGYLLRTSGALHLEVVLARLGDLGLEVRSFAALPSYTLQTKDGCWHEDQGSVLDPEAIVAVREPWVRVSLSGQDPHRLAALAASRGWAFSLRDGCLEAAVSSAEFLSGLYRELMSLTGGELAIEARHAGTREGELALIKLYVNEGYTGFWLAVTRPMAAQVARELVATLAEGFRRTAVPIRIQARLGAKALASARVSPYARDVTRGLYGGDESRKKKQREKQARGKRKLMERGEVRFDRSLLLKRRGS